MISRISSMSITNFMSIGKAEIDFTREPITAICGRNDSGKSAVVRLLDIMFYNSYGTEQVKFIKDGEDYFEGVLYFDDGVTYTRRKYQTGNTFYELKKDDKILYTNQQGRAFIAVNEVPQEISTYLGVLKDMYTGEKLNIRRCTDRMFLIETSGGDNYKIFNSILRSEALAQATTKMNKDRNSLHQQYVVSLNQLTALQQEYIRAKLPKEEVISRIAVQNKVVKAKSEQLQGIRGIREREKKYRGVQIPKEVRTISADVLERAEQAERLKNTVTRYRGVKIPRELSAVEVERFGAISEIQGTREKYQDIQVPRAINVVSVSGVEQYKEIADIKKSAQKYAESDSQYAEVEREYNEVRAELEEQVKKYGLVICTKCGNVMEYAQAHEHKEGV